jgi:hypothetical protein
LHIGEYGVLDISRSNENLIYVFLFWELRGLSPNFHIHVYVNDSYIPRIGPRAKFGTCTVESVNGTVVAAKMCTFTLESTHFIFNKCLLYTHDSASAKISINSHETVYSAHTFLQQNSQTDHGSV